MDFSRLTNDNFALFAAKYYDNPTCSGVEEFNEDLARIIYVKRLLRKYERTGELRDRLIMNHLITLYNVFGSKAATKMLFYKLEPDLHGMLKTFIVFLGYVNDKTLSDEGIDIVRIPLDEVIITRLRSI